MMNHGSGWMGGLMGGGMWVWPMIVVLVVVVLVVAMRRPTNK